MLDPVASRFGQAALHSGLMDVAALLACWEAIPPAKREAPEHIDRRLARQAVQSKALTLWQAQQLLAGRTTGFKVDRYVLEELIGQGGMGRVYLARDTRLKRRVALKILAPERISNPRAVARFQREARVGAQLQHENLVRVYDFGESNGRFFLVMEFIEGKTIGHLLSEQGPMPPATAARLVQQVAQGLAHAHRKGMIHRDVNPYNILVTHEGIAKLADLGLAIDIADEDRVTREGATVGTFDYVAPEQARHSHSADIRSDIYSLGCTLYHMLSGQVPFPSPSLPEKLLAHQAMEPTPLEQLVPGLPACLADVVRTMMRKKPEERYGTPAQVVQALDPFIDEGLLGGRGDAGGARSDLNRWPDVSRRSGSSSASIRTAVTPVSAADLASSAASGSGSGPGSPPPDGRCDLAATSAAPASMVAAPRTTVAGAPLPTAAAALAGSPGRTGPELDDPSIPLLTPTEDVVPEGGGLPIVVEIDHGPLLGPAPGRARSAPGSGLANLFSRIAEAARSHAGPRSAEVGPGIAIGSIWRSAPWAVRAAIVAALLVAVLILLLGLAGRLGAPWERPSPSGSPRIGAAPKSTDRPRPPRRAREERRDILVRSHGAGADEDGGVPARTLMEGVKAAMGRGRSGYVELRNSEPLQLGAADFIDVGSASGTLDIRAAGGIRPVIEVHMDPKRPFLATGSAVTLKLTGLTIRAHYASTAGATPAAWPALIQVAGRSVRLDRCAFEVEGPRPDGCRALMVVGGNLTVGGCRFEGFDEAIRAQAYGATVIQLHQTKFVPGIGGAPSTSSPPRGWALGIELLPGGDSKRRLILDHCTIEGAGLLDLTGGEGRSALPADVRYCDVRADALLAWRPRKPGDRLEADLRWEGLGNRFQVGGRFWVVQSARTMTPASTIGVTDLKSWSQFVVREAESPEPAGADPDRVGPPRR